MIMARRDCMGIIPMPWALFIMLVLGHPRDSSAASSTAADMGSTWQMTGRTRRQQRLQTQRHRPSPLPLEEVPSSVGRPSSSVDDDARDTRRVGVTERVPHLRALRAPKRAVHQRGEQSYDKEVRIVNGTEVDRNRYPYLAALTRVNGAVSGAYDQDPSANKRTRGGGEFYKNDEDDNWWSRGVDSDRAYRTTPTFDRSHEVKILDYDDTTLIVDVGVRGGKEKIGNSVKCGAFLVMPDVVLTATHCKRFAKFAHLDRHDMRSETESYDTCKVLERAVHPQYNATESTYDLALLRLDCESTATPVRLNDDPGFPDVTTELLVIGWGDTRDGGSPSDVPLQAHVDFMSNTECQERYVNDTISDDMLCAFRLGKDSCQGDSGGPLIATGNSAEDDTLVGVVSWGDKCAHSYYPGVYARVSTAIDWIREEMCSLSGTTC